MRLHILVHEVLKYAHSPLIAFEPKRHRSCSPLSRIIEKQAILVGRRPPDIESFGFVHRKHPGQCGVETLNKRVNDYVTELHQPAHLDWFAA
jgi:hypothetical protein